MDSSTAAEGFPTTIELSDRDVEDARRLLGLLSGLAGSPRTEAVDERAGNDARRQRARDELIARRRRAEVLPRAMFGEPAWEMLLVLYASDRPDRPTIRRLTERSGVTHTTALRWLDYLESHQLIERRAHPHDKRSAFVELTSEGRRRLDLYFGG